MDLVVNGERTQVVLETRTVEGLVTALALPKDRVAIELNGSIVTKGARATTTLKDGDVLEVVTLVGGG